MGVPPFLVTSCPGGDLAGGGLVAVGFLVQPRIIECMESGEGFLSGNSFLCGGDFGQVQAELVEGFMLDGFRACGGCVADVALNMY